ncbi:DMT family transporter [Curvibacter sp. CHRR-16]|uniref:DMT family transporter n=1 Tax=Curvibacter sp. CHRR-16 TaxID=2835872 RepID=UPI001BD9AC39|nr:DMT family transporter [Curvibacter sp. CHRR-16]MBT0571594.1 DMT family transporter [Curvibacter sp. CHRR-16]
MTSSKLSPSTVALLIIPPLLWAGNAVVGRWIAPQISPLLLNLLRWVLAGIIVLPWAWRVLRRGSALWQDKSWFTRLSLLSIGAYNALLYLALQTSSPINVTLVSSSIPLWMLLLGWLFFGARVQWHQLCGGLLSMAGVLVVLSRGDWQVLLHLKLVAGDGFVLAAAIAWAIYSWMLAKPSEASQPVRAQWADFLLGQIVFGLGWCALSAGGEWAMGASVWQPSWGLWLALAYIAVGPAVLAYALWGLGVKRAGPAAASLFINLMPLFTALLSLLLLGEHPQLYHGTAFVLLVAGIVLSSLQSSRP